MTAQAFNNPDLEVTLSAQVARIRAAFPFESRSYPVKTRTSSVRLCTPSFPNTRRSWLATVLGEVPRARAISAYG